MELEYQAKQEANNTRAVIGMVLLMIVLLGVFFYIGEKENIDHKRNKRYTGVYISRKFRKQKFSKM